MVRTSHPSGSRLWVAAGRRPCPWHVLVPQKALELSRLCPGESDHRLLATPEGASTSWLAADARLVI